MSQQIIDRSYVGEVLQRMYENDFNVKVAFIAEGGYFYFENDGQKHPLHGTNVEEAVTHLALHLTRQFPLSRFAEWWRDNFSSEHQGGEGRKL